MDAKHACAVRSVGQKEGDVDTIGRREKKKIRRKYDFLEGAFPIENAGAL
jgi:hypothetical protein